MRLSLVLFTLLCVNMWMGFVHTTNGPVATCCERWSNTKIPYREITNYTIQTEGVCPIRAIKFDTIFGKRICSHPDDPWARRVMLKIVDKRRTLLRQGQGGEEETGRTTRGPASSTGNKKRPRRICQHRRRRFKKGQRKNV